jgi:tRNA-5-taurinomethyluridine 2-sulfurtransferase
MGICFIGKKAKFEEFLSKFIDPIEGHFVDIDSGKRILNLKHKGVHNFTIGKRIPPQMNAGKLMGNNTEGLYVAEIDAKNQTIFVVQSKIN